MSGNEFNSILSMLRDEVTPAFDVTNGSYNLVITLPGDVTYSAHPSTGALIANGGDLIELRCQVRTVSDTKKEKPSGAGRERQKFTGHIIEPAPVIAKSYRVVDGSLATWTYGNQQREGKVYNFTSLDDAFNETAEIWQSTGLKIKGDFQLEQGA